MTRPERLTGNPQLWSPKLGIRFSPPARAPLYPQLDVSRFVQTASTSSTVISDGANESFECCATTAVRDDMTALSIEHRVVKAITPARSCSALTTERTQTPGHVSVIISQETEDQAETATADIETKAHSEEIEPPSTPLSFNISHDLFRAARAAKAGSSESFWSHTMYQQTTDEGTLEKVKVHYCTSNHTMEQICQEHFLGQEVLGFDLEWFPYAKRTDGARENVSLIQLASPGHIGLFHVAIFAADDELVSPTLRQIMEDPNVSKVGVQVQGDCRRMKNYLDVQVQGIFELSHLYKQVRFTAANTPNLINKVSVALATQVEEVLKLPLFKGDLVRSSNWTKRLNHRQILYSASDAYAGLQLYHVLESQRKALDPCPSRPHHVELGLPIPKVEPKLAAKDEVDEDEDEDEDADEDASDDSFSSLDSDIEAALLNLTISPIESRPTTRDPRILAAEQRSADYRASKKSSVRARPTALRAYYIWHDNTNLKPEEIAKICRDPPLKTNTVVSYILDAIVSEELPHDKGRLKSEVLHWLDQNAIAGGRYEVLAKSCENA